ncbi:MAG: radical SAM/SPASM domain-containing protein [Candidatus Muiribacteriota bacterium]
MKIIPQTLIIELTNFCNFNCLMCTVRRNNPSFMDKKLFLNILDQIWNDDLNFDIFLPFFRGESLLHPQFREFMEIFLKKNNQKKLIQSCGIDTNGSMLTEESSDFILKNDLFSFITFSCDAIKPETYSQIRKNGNIALLIENIKYFIKKRKKLNKNYPTITLQYIVMNENIDEIDKFIYFWQRFFKENNIELFLKYDYDKPEESMGKDAIFIRKINDFPGGKKQSEYDRIYKETIKKLFKTEVLTENKIEICGGPFTHTVISHNGLVFPCCFDTEDRLLIGDLRKEKLKNIISGEKLFELRKQHAELRKNENEICRDCPGQVFPVFDKKHCGFLKDYFNL